MFSDDVWIPTVRLRWSLLGTLQQQWHRQVGDYDRATRRSSYRMEYEWRDVPTQQVEMQPAQETAVECGAKSAFDHVCRRLLGHTGNHDWEI